RVAPSRDVWGDALARAASRRPPARRVRRAPNWMCRRRTVVLTATAFAIAGLAAAGVVAFGVGSARAAYDVTTNPDGTVTIILRQSSAPRALNRESAPRGPPPKPAPVPAPCAFTPPRHFPPHFLEFVPPNAYVGRPLRPTDTIRIGTSGLSRQGVVGLIAVG